MHKLFIGAVLVAASARPSRRPKYRSARSRSWCLMRRARHRQPDAHESPAIIDENKWSPGVDDVTTGLGGIGAIGNNYLINKKGDSHVIAGATPMVVSGKMRGRLPGKPPRRDDTLMIVAIDELMLSVRTSPPYRHRRIRRRRARQARRAERWAHRHVHRSHIFTHLFEQFSAKAS